MGESGREPDSGRDPLILEVKGNSLDDGPGIRTVLFFKGCPLSCSWCHNPESKRAGVELSYDPRECAGCRTCVVACKRCAVDPYCRDFIDRSRCDLCFDCVEACPSGALSRVGKVIDAEALAGEVERDLPFFRTSGGGVTLSGGEPTLFMEYCSRLLCRLEEMGVHRIVETCGYFDYDEFARLVMPHVDSVYFDLKLSDPALHREHCGVENEGIFSNFELLFADSRAGAPEVLPRIPLVPGITATDENLSALASFLRSMGVSMVALLQYNPLWIEKNAKIGRKDALEGRAGADSWMTRQELERCRAHFTGFELV